MRTNLQGQFTNFSFSFRVHFIQQPLVSHINIFHLKCFIHLTYWWYFCISNNWTACRNLCSSPHWLGVYFNQTTNRNNFTWIDGYPLTFDNFFSNYSQANSGTGVSHNSFLGGTWWLENINFNYNVMCQQRLSAKLTTLLFVGNLQ